MVQTGIVQHFNQHHAIIIITVIDIIIIITVMTMF